ncbi:MAG: MFS transporter [Chloroflexi bacterium]|nr:MFS transporter [Chloroflexota bacterium]
MQNTPVYKNRWIGLLFICVSLLVISIDNTILNVALPAISRDLGASSSDLQWIVDAYILVFAALLLTMGSVGDRIGRKRILQIGLVIFGIGSLWAALANSTDILIAARGFLGIGAAIIMPATLSIITATFPREERSQAIAIWAAVFGLGVGIGPVMGGWLLESYAWNSVFFVNLPVIATALIGGAIFLGESRDETAPRSDIPGVLLSIPGLFALVYGIIEAGVVGWTEPNVLVAFGAAVVLLGLFAWWENRAPNAMLPLYFFRNMSFTGANTAMALIMFSLFGSIFFMSQYLQTVLGYTALEGGIRIVPLALTMAVTSALSAQITKRLGTKRTVALGILILSSGLFYMSGFEVSSTYGDIVVGLIIIATGMGLAVSPATDSIMGSVPPNKAGVGSAMNDTTRELGGAMGVAVLGTIMNSRYIADVETLRQQIPILPDDAFSGISDSIQAAHIIAADPRVPDFAREAIISTADQAFVAGMNEAMLIGSAIMLFAAVVAYVLLPNQVQPAGHGVQDESGLEFRDAVPSPALGD